MDASFYTLFLLPAGLGLLGFIEPCTIGGHLLFLQTQSRRARGEKIRAVLVFTTVRALVAGLFGALIGFAGRYMIGVQTGLWLVFGLIYLALGLAFLTGRAGVVKKQIDLAPDTWKRAQSPVVLGLAFGLNIPACAAPILFALLGLAATTGTVLSGFVMMMVFGLFLSLPLGLFAVLEGLAGKLDTLDRWFGRARWMLGTVFGLLGVWSIWFGLYVDPAKWAGQ